MENERSSGRGWPWQRLKTEAFLLLGLLALGMWLVPALIFLVGSRILGPYGEIDSLAAFYIDLFGSLLDGRGIAWLLVGSLYLFLSLIRLLIWLWLVLNRSAARHKGLDAE
ncbi:MAG: hypothetical protein IH835_01710 [Proteobacteria bacterium]|nr:hypothetical protein [Pseudomonadota bacterium]